MALRRQEVFLALSVFLLLSVAPIDSARVLDAQQAGNVKHVQGASFWGATCEQLQERFENHASATSASFDLAQNSSGRQGFLTTASLLLKTVRMTRTLQRAANRECQWAEAGSANTTSLMKIVEASQKTNPCLPRANEILSADVDDDAAEFDNFMTAMQVLVSPTCDLPEATEEEVEAEDDDVVEEDLEEEEDALTTALMDDIDGGAGGASFLQEGEEQPIQSYFINFIWPPPSPVGMERLVSGGITEWAAGTGPQNAGQWLIHILGASIWLLGFALLCTAALYVIAFVVSVVFCFLRFLVGMILRRSWTVEGCVGNAMGRLRSGTTGRRVMMGACAVGGVAVVGQWGGVTHIAGPPPLPPIPPR